MGDTKYAEPVEVGAAIAASYEPPWTGRPSSIDDPELVAKLLDYLAQGLHVEPACSLAGLSRSAYSKWMQRADDEEQRGEYGTHAAFKAAVQKARAQAEHSATAAMSRAWNAGPQYWAAGATFLERSYPDRWGRRAPEDSGPRVVVQIGTQSTTVSLGDKAVSDKVDYVNLQVVDSTALASSPALPVPIVLGAGARTPTRGARGGRVGRPPKKHQA